MMSPAMAAVTPAKGSATQKENPSRVIKMAEVYPPTPAKAACPSEICPVNPVRMLSPMAAMTANPIMLATYSR